MRALLSLDRPQDGFVASQVPACGRIVGNPYLGVISELPVNRSWIFSASERRVLSHTRVIARPLPHDTQQGILATPELASA